MAGQLQNEDFKTEAEITGVGGTKSQLPNDDKIYVTSTGERLDEAIDSGSLYKPQVYDTTGVPQLVSTNIVLAGMVKPKVVAFIAGDAAPVAINVADIQSGVFIGQELRLIGKDTVNTVTINDLSSGLVVLSDNIIVDLIWDGATWIGAGGSN